MSNLTLSLTSKYGIRPKTNVVCLWPYLTSQQIYRLNAITYLAFPKKKILVRSVLKLQIMDARAHDKTSYAYVLKINIIFFGLVPEVSILTHLRLPIMQR